MKKKPICIFANSVKNQQSCVAGIELVKKPDGKWQNTKKWIRPISHRPNGAISYREAYLIEKQRVPRLFDIIEVPLERPAHVEGQPEDWLIVNGEPWKYLEHIDSLSSIEPFLEQPQDLWFEEKERRDRVTPEYIAQNEMPSLYLVKPDEIIIYVMDSDFGNGSKRRRRASIKYRGVTYDMGMTDPDISKKYFHNFISMPSGIDAGISLQVAGICVSLAPVWKIPLSSRPYHFKLVAAIIESK